MAKNSNNSSKRERQSGKMGIVKKMRNKINDGIHFLTYDIWRVNPDNFSGKRNGFYNVIKIIILTIRGIQEQDLGASSRSLTYRTVLSLVPMLAVLFAIARGFGFENILESQIFDFFSSVEHESVTSIERQPIVSDSLVSMGDLLYPGLPADSLSPFKTGAAPLDDPSVAETTSFTLEAILLFVNNSLEHAKGGVFAGVGIILLLYTIVLLFTDIENSFNRIWSISKGRSLQRRIIDYFALVLLLPVFIVVNYSLTAFIQASTSFFDNLSFIMTPLVSQVLNVLPFFVMIITLTLLYKFMPNTKVKWYSAITGGVVGGIAIQLFQMVYLEGQLWISKYNAIYGAFAALPLLLLWTQMSWFIVLIGAELSFSAQNVRQFFFDRETTNISRRYLDFFTIMIASVIVKRFAKGEYPYTAAELSVKCKIPIKLTNDIIDELIRLEMILPTPLLEDDRVLAYQPAFDINQMSVCSLLELIDKSGSEDFLIDTEKDFAPHWRALKDTRKGIYAADTDVLLRDL